MSNDDLMSHLGRAVAAAKADRVRVVEADHATDCPHCGRTTDDRIRKCPGCRALLASVLPVEPSPQAMPPGSVPGSGDGTDLTLTMRVVCDEPATVEQVTTALRRLLPIGAGLTGFGGFWLRYDGNQIHAARITDLTVEVNG